MLQLCAFGLSWETVKNPLAQPVVQFVVKKEGAEHF